MIWVAASEALLSVAIESAVLIRSETAWSTMLETLGCVTWAAAWISAWYATVTASIVAVACAGVIGSEAVKPAAMLLRFPSKVWVSLA